MSSKLRKQLPALTELGRYDLPRLVGELEGLGLFRTETWPDLNFEGPQGPKFKAIAQQHVRYYTQWFDFGHRAYGDLFLNEIDYDLIDKAYAEEDFLTPRSRARVATDVEKLSKQYNAENIFKPVLKPAYRGTYLEEVYHDLAKHGAGGVGRAKLAFMLPHTEVKWHIDMDSALVMKAHIPLKTNADCKFYVRARSSTEVHTMPADGRAWLLNVGLPHRVVNGAGLRFHFIVNVYMQPLLSGAK